MLDGLSCSCSPLKRFTERRAVTSQYLYSLLFWYDCFYTAHGRLWTLRGSVVYLDKYRYKANSGSCRLSKRPSYLLSCIFNALRLVYNLQSPPRRQKFTISSINIAERRGMMFPDGTLHDWNPTALAPDRDQSNMLAFSLF